MNRLSKQGYQVFTSQLQAPLGFTEHGLAVLWFQRNS